MKKILLASTVLAAMTGVAAAADLPSRMAPPVYAPPPLPVFTWTGAYFGINAGYAFDHEGRFRVAPTDPGFAAAVGGGAIPGGLNSSSDGFTGGGQIGYNYQFGGGGFGGPGSGIVVGVEADAAYTDLDQRRTIDPLGIGVNTQFRSGLDYLGTVRGRLGYSFGQFLVYGTGGFAYGGVNNRFNVSTPALGVLASGRNDSTETGYAYGGGIEYALPTNSFLNFFKSSAVTIKAEYLHYDLGRSNINVVDTTGAISGAAGTSLGRARVSNSGDIARVGLNYKFGSY